MGKIWKIFTVLTLVFCGCKKENETIVTGTVSDFYSGGAIGQVQIEFAYSELRNGTYSTGYTDLGEAVSDASGKYSFEFQNVSAVNYRVRLRKAGYFFKEMIIRQDEWKRNQENIFDPTLFQQASIRFRFFNSSSPENQVLFSLDEHSDGCSSCCNTNNIHVSGVNDTTFVCDVYGNQTIGYELTRITSDDAQTTTGVIQVTAGEKVFELSYD